MQNILNGRASLGEVLTNYVRDINFRLTVKDNKSGEGRGVFLTNES